MIDIIKAEETEKSGIKYFNINVSREEVERNPDIVRLCSDIGILEYVKQGTEGGNYRKSLDMAIKALDQEPKFIIKADGSIEQIINKDMNDTLDTIKSVIKHQKYWLFSAGYSMRNVDLAFDTIEDVIERLRP